VRAHQSALLLGEGLLTRGHGRRQTQRRTERLQHAQHLHEYPGQRDTVYYQRPDARQHLEHTCNEWVDSRIGSDDVIVKFE
jgi:hypothetical protein